MPTGLRSPRRTPLRACRRSARAWASSSATVPAVTPCQIERDRWSRRVRCARHQSKRPSGRKRTYVPLRAKARCRGGTQGGKAPPSPKTTISGLTRGQVFGEDQVGKQDLPGSAGRAARPSGGLFRFLAQRLQNSAQITLRHWVFGTAARAPSSAARTIRTKRRRKRDQARQGEPLGLRSAFSSAR